MKNFEFHINAFGPRMNGAKLKISLALLIIFTLFLEGCASLPLFKHDFKKMFTPHLSRIEDNPVIIIPGMIGSRLVDGKTGKMAWGSLRTSQIFRLSEREDIALPIDSLPIGDNRDDIVSKGIIDRYEFPIEIIEFTVYRELLYMFEEIGYRLGDIRNPKPEDNLYVFDYDWRRDNVENAKILAERIEHIKKVAKNPHMRFNLLCHSMGGLIGRYYMRYGGRDVLGQSPNFKVTCEGAKNIKRLILIGIPNLGSMPVFEYLHKGLDLTIVKYPPYIMFTMPSIYQLLPPRYINSFVDENGDYVEIDLYDIQNWKKFDWSVYSEKINAGIKSRYKVRFKDDWEAEFKAFEVKRDRFIEAALKRADLFHKALNFKSKRKIPCEIILFGGDMVWTKNKAILAKDKKSGKWQTYFWDRRLSEKILMPGDGIVTRESLLGVPVASTTKNSWADSPIEISFALFVARRHENIHKDATFQNNLLHILLGDWDNL